MLSERTGKLSKRIVMWKNLTLKLSKDVAMWEKRIRMLSERTGMCENHVPKVVPASSKVIQVSKGINHVSVEGALARDFVPVHCDGCGLGPGE